jgi:ribosome biogenesis ATPase
MSLNSRMAAQWASNRKLNLNSPLPQPTSVDIAENGPTGMKTPSASTPDALGTISESLPASTPSNLLASGVSNGLLNPTRKRKTQEPSGDETPQKKPKSISSSTNAKPSTSQSKTPAAKSYLPPSTRLADLGGLGGTVEKLLELVAMPLRHPEIYAHTGVQPPRGVLLHGPPGCGKTMLAHAIAGVSSDHTLDWWFLTTLHVLCRNSKSRSSASRHLPSFLGCQENPKRPSEIPSRRQKYVCIPICPIQLHKP